MNIGFLGTSHAAQHLELGARARGLEVVSWYDADIAFISEDTRTDQHGSRDLKRIRNLVDVVMRGWQGSTVVLTSAVPPGFTRSFGISHIIHQAETLRMRDALERARRPEMLIVGTEDPAKMLPAPYKQYLAAFDCPVLLMTWEEAEFAKIAINATLASQVENTNRLAKAAEAVGARWHVIADVLRHDSRIGPKAYLDPGRWEDSPHLMRDMVTLEAIGQ